ncbi:MAG: T9SS type A sorting domain-containing protein [Chitinophagaceae bacterium]
MKKFYSQFITLFILLCVFQVELFSQASVHSSKGYSVNLNVYPVAIVPTSLPCAAWGYNYTVKLNYNITFSGNSSAALLWTLNGSVGCGSNTIGFPLPLTGGSGSTNSYITSSYVPDCYTATVASKNCNRINLNINGDGINYQTVSYASIGTTLGIQLMAFSADLAVNKVKVTWATASETNNEYFSIERSTDNAQWNEIKRIAGAGNSGSLLTYQTYDESPVAGTSYYRLKQTDIDGKFSYSNTISVKYNPSAKGVSLFPVPNTGNTVNITGISNYSNHEVTVLNVNGAVLFTTTLTKSSVDLPSLNAGVYVIRIKDKTTNEIENLRYVKM